MPDEVRCARAGCGHGFRSSHGLVDHLRGGGPCLVGSAWGEQLCRCDGFLWVDPEPAPDVDQGYPRTAPMAS